MPAPFNKPAEPPQGLPDPELNPMTNPLLAKNMGRWAEVYFTTPPEKREEAVQELLRELNEQQQNEQVLVSAPATKLKDDSAVAIVQDATVCPACLHRNRQDDRFCGLCGFPLSSSTRHDEAADIGAMSAKANPATTERTEHGWEWLRDRNLASLQSSVTSETRHSWKYAVAGTLLLASMIGIFVVWTSRTTVQPASAKPHAQPLSQPEPAANAAEVLATSRDTPKSQEVPPKHSDVGSGPRNDSSVPVTASDDQDHNSILSSSDNDPADDGAQELFEGKRYLAGDGVLRNTRTASQWLWRAVAKQNSDAILLLSDLYMRGDGVPQSCDQARVLLTAAVKRGSLQAGEKLAAMRESTCH